MALRMRKLFATLEKRAPGHKKISEVSSAAEISPERSLKQKPLTRPLLVYSTCMTLTQMAMLELVFKKTAIESTRGLRIKTNQSVSVNVNQNSNGEVIAGDINRRSSSGWKEVTLILAAILP